ncbi:cancer-related nucleoside-triphosphatase-like [Sinocyclocheilus grahami]|uniref:cancer-related nucleoside-triphosphatase-like n=1 Tax=Sinocyclocheilus grahami TaxID=75366 RepID=UPI0007ACD765|nr:PREDICTED: cancer-related nucleoside-triphosphatase-like [Sinocyclocheilus grahami]
MEQMREGSKRLFVIDEIGKMELFSQAFIRAVRQTLDASSCSILGTIPVPKGKPLALVEEVRSRQDVKIFMITKENRDVIFDDIVSAVQVCLKNTSHNGQSSALLIGSERVRPSWRSD